jgi:hypothetical protein
MSNQQHVTGVTSPGKQCNIIGAKRGFEDSCGTSSERSPDDTACAFSKYPSIASSYPQAVTPTRARLEVMNFMPTEEDLLTLEEMLGF